MSDASWLDEVRSEHFGMWTSKRTPRVMPQAHRHDEVELNYLTGGSMVYQWGGDVVTVPAECLALFWAAVPHQVIETEPDSTLFVFTMPLAQTLQWRLPKRLEQMLLSGRMLVDAAPMPSDYAQCILWHQSLGSGETDEIETTQIEMYARLRRMSAHLPESPSPIADGSASSPAERRPVQIMSRYVANHYSQPISIADVAAAAELHPGYAMELFRRTVGRTIGDYINQYRLFHARRLLMTTDLKVLDIAFDSGFGSASRFYESFGRAYGESPSAFRAKSRKTS